ncbi:hypothetical protein NBRC111894_2936 [Sporolactobacillus inulinus]|uniref:Uncharacterized protein n=1 Tax=Sporolactobacillus inulinus TaxID=2078 RepID=A0A4Y1ZE16_9BACL|nr:hypothetical protein NBRC111894_2936 [Sporolactobacillus inulinus]
MGKKLRFLIPGSINTNMENPTLSLLMTTIAIGRTEIVEQGKLS